MQNIVWIYWETLDGKSEPPHISLCREILRSKLADKYSLRLVTPDNISDYLPDIHENIYKIKRDIKPDEHCLAIKTGFIRIFLLEKYGGLYIDSDAILLGDLSPVFENIKKYGFICTRRSSSPKKHIPNNFIGSVPDGKIIKEYAEKQREILSKRTVYRWGEIGADMLTPIVNNNSESVYIYNEKFIQPLHAGKQHLYMDKNIRLEDIISDETLVFMLFHRIFDGENKRCGLGLKYYDIEDLYYSNILVSKVFRHALPVDDYEIFLKSYKKNNLLKKSIKMSLLRLYSFIEYNLVYKPIGLLMRN